ncbi:MAG: glycosyl hydrolase [Cytophagaceae bacterium]
MKTLRHLAIILFVLITVEASAQVSPKRGSAYGYHSAQDMAVLSQGISWWYNWSSTPDGTLGGNFQGVEFVPMFWNNNFNIQQAIANIPQGTKYILAYNEPNFTVEANMTPQYAATVWWRIEQVAAARNLEIVSASPAYCGGSVCLDGYTDPIKWHDDFFAACPTCKVDHIAFHTYEPTSGGAIALTNNLKKYNRPIWVTEFALWDPNVSTTNKVNYLNNVVNAYENDPDIYRYSWFTGRSTSNSTVNLLGANGTLTTLGTAYVNASYGPKNTIPGKIEAERHYRRRGTGLEPTTDAGGGQNVGWTDPGDWNEYIVNVSSTGNYKFTFRVAGQTATGSLNIKLNGNIIKSNVTITPSGGWQTWKDVVVDDVILPAGENLLRFDFTAGGFNINYFATTLINLLPPDADFSANMTSSCTGNQIVFSDETTNKTGGDTYSWNFGTGANPSTATGAGPHTVSYSTGGNKTVNLTVSNANGSNTKTKTDYIQISDAPTTCIFQDHFNNGIVNWITPPTSAFTHTESGNAWTISTTGHGEWDSFTYTLNNGSIASAVNFKCTTFKPIVRIRAKASSNCLLRLSLMDANGRAIDNISTYNLELTQQYQTFTINYAGLFRNYHSGNPGMLDSTNINRLAFSFNPGFHSYPHTGTNATYNSFYSGTIDIDWIGIGEPCPVPVISGNSYSSTSTNENLIFPNPFTQSTTLKLQEGKMASLKIADMQGRVLIVKESITSAELKFGEELEPGIYQVVISSGEEVNLFKLIKAE